MRVLVTGAAGRVGRTVVQGLHERYTLRGFDRVQPPEPADWFMGEISDLSAVSRAVQGMDAIIHLAGVASSRHPWEQVLQSNIVGTYNVFEAAREAGVRRIAFASRAGLLSGYPEDRMRTVDLPPRPTDFYSVSKVFGEALAYMYATTHGMEVVCVRIGKFLPDQPEPNHPHHLGRRDCVRLFERAIIHPGVRFEIVFGVSASNWRLYDIDHARRAIGYEPVDYAQMNVYPGQEK